MSYDVGHSCSSNLVLLWQWRRPAATALIRLLAWEFPYYIEENMLTDLKHLSVYLFSCSVGQGSSIALSCGVGPRCGLDLAELWLWHRPAATALIRPLA